MGRPEIEVRRAGPADAVFLAALHGRCFDEPWSAESFAVFLAAPDCIGLVADEGDGPPAGFALARVAADEAEVLTLAVTPERRRLGLGERLTRALLPLLARAGARRLFLEVAAGNAGALALYTRLGFVGAGERKAYYGRGAGARDARLMRLDLPASVDASPPPSL